MQILPNLIKCPNHDAQIKLQFLVLYWTTGCNQKAPMKQVLSIRPSNFSSLVLSGHFLRIDSLVFSKFDLRLKTYIKLCVTELDYVERFFFTKSSVFKKNPFPKIWVKMLSEMMKCPDILHGDTNLGKVKVASMIFGWVWSKMVVSIQFMELQNLLISKMNSRIELIFCMLIVMQ